MSTYSKTIFMICILTIILAAKAVLAEGPKVYLTYQGHLVDAGGLNITDSLPIEIRLYDSLMGGVGFGLDNSHLIYAEKHEAVDLFNGNFRLRIGEGLSLLSKWAGLPVDELKKTENVYLELWIDGERLSPRQKMGSVGAVVRSDVVRFADDVLHFPPITADMLPAYDAGRIKSGVFGASQMPNIDASRISGVLTNNMPSLDTSKFSTSGTLPKNVIGASQITSGEISVSQLPDNILKSSDYDIRMNSLGNNQMLTMSEGYSDAECSYVLSPGITEGNVEGIDQFHVALNGSKVLGCSVTEGDGISNPGKVVYCSAGYLSICKK